MTTRTIKFNGFASGSAITIAAALSTGPSDSATTGAGGWGVAGGASAEITIERRHVTKTAPEAIYFSVTNLSGFDATSTHAPTNNAYNPQRHEVEVFWSFGDPGATYSAPVNTLVEHKNRNVAKGHRAAHVYREPGDYTVTAFLVEMSSGKTATATFTLASGGDADPVADPDVTFAGKTVTVNSAGGADYTSLTAALTAVKGNGDFRRIVVEDGHAETMGAYNDTNDNLGTSIYIQWENGGGARPDIDKATGGGPLFRVQNPSSTPADIVISGLSVAGTWDSTTETGDWINRFCEASNVNATTNLLLDDNRIDGCSTGIYNIGGPPGSPLDLSICVHDCLFTNWSDYGCQLGGIEFCSLLGDQIAQHVDALSGGPKDRTHNNHGPLRIGDIPRLVIDGCDLYSRDGWTLAGSYYWAQPCMRLATTPLEGAETDVTRNAMEGGFYVMAISRHSDGVDCFTQNSVVDSNVIVGTHMTKHLCYATLGGLTFRNNLLQMPNTERLSVGALSVGAFVNIPPTLDGLVEADHGLILDSPVRIYSNTFLNFMADANDPDGNAIMAVTDYFDYQFSDVTVENNIVYQPNAASYSGADYTPLDDAVLLSPRELGYRDFNNPTLLDQYATPPDTIWSGRPEIGSEALGAALTGLTSYSDIRMQQRPIYPSVGAWEI